MNKTGKLLIPFILLIILTAFCPLVFNHAENHVERPASLVSIQQDDSFKPTVTKPAWADQDNNAIADSLDKEIADRIANGTAQDYANVTVMLKATPGSLDVEDFVSAGGYLTTPLWTKATYGFGGAIRYFEIVDFVRRCSNVLLVEKEVVGEFHVAYAAQQIGARTYVWNTLGLQGDPNSSTAIVDTGIDGSHVAFSPGYGDRDFSKKIVGWNDQVGSTTSPGDDNGHGSHVAGLAAGNGFFSVDTSGNAVATWGDNLGSVSSSGTYLTSGMMVNKTGTILINVRWASTGTASLSSLILVYGGKTLSTGSWTQIASVSTPSQNTFYPLTYNVASTPSGGYDMYQVLLSLTAGKGDLYVAFTMSWPYTPPSDGFLAWTGIAPQSKLVGVKVLNSTGSGTTTNMLRGINWIISNRLTYHITVASLSLGYSEEVSVVNSAVLNLVNSGVTVVVAAGNNGLGSNYVYTCGSVDEVITVAAMNQFDNIASYSSQGGISRYTGKTTKPDITAPGGSRYGVQLFSVDSNYDDSEGRFIEIQANDSAPMSGTSMATPLISGGAQVLIQAMGGYTKWNWTRSQALQPKMLLLMAATETYPNLREGGTSSTSPTLERGGKDVHEGYGRVNLDASVDALLKSYTLGSVATDTLGRPPTLTDISVLGQKLAWARNVQLFSGNKYNFSLSLPVGADYDLYLYNNTGTYYGEPAIVAKSINATTGGTEQFWVTAPYTGTYYIVVKRATETTGSGTFTLTSSGLAPVNVTLNTFGLPNASNVVYYTQNGASKTGSIVASTFSDYCDIGTTLTIDNPIYVSTTQRYMTTETTSFAVQSNATFTINYSIQYYLAISSAYGTTGGAGWYNSGASTSATVSQLVVAGTPGTQYVFSDWSGDALGNTSPSSAIIMNGPKTVTANWKTQYYISVISGRGAPTPSQWADQGASFTASVISPTEIVTGDNQWVCTGFNLDGSVSQAGTGPSYTFTNLQAPHTIVFNWKKQFYLTVASIHGAPTGAGWYDSGSTANAALDSGIVAGGLGTRYVFTGWGGDASGTTLTSSDIVMGSAKTATATWKTQYYLTLSSAHSSTIGSGWYDSDTFATPTVTPSIVAGPEGTRFVFSGWTESTTEAAQSNSLIMNSSKTATAIWKTQYHLALSTDFGSVSPDSGWYDAASTVTISAMAPLVNSGERYVWRGWAGIGLGSYSGTDNLVSVTINGPINETASWTHQYLLTVTSAYGAPMPTNEWFDSGTLIHASVNSPIPESFLTQHVCIGWTGTGSVPKTGKETGVTFRIDQASAITWNWESQYILPNTLTAIVVTIALIVSIVSYILRRRHHKPTMT